MIDALPEASVHATLAQPSRTHPRRCSILVDALVLDIETRFTCRLVVKKKEIRSLSHTFDLTGVEKNCLCRGTDFGLEFQIFFLSYVAKVKLSQADSSFEE